VLGWGGDPVVTCPEPELPLGAATEGALPIPQVTAIRMAIRTRMVSSKGLFVGKRANNPMVAVKSY
jgi:hypothetical protein